MQFLVTATIAALLLLVPVQFLVLPMTMSPVDVFGFLALPVCWLWLLHVRRPIRLPLLGAFWLIVVTSAVSCLASLDPKGSFIALVKAVYLYLWLVTLCSAWENLGPRHVRWLQWAWLASAVANGVLIVAQFLHPPLLASMNASVAGIGGLDEYRPSGLLANSNAASFFQLLAFVPLITLGLPRLRTFALGLFLLLTLLGTGSMAGMLAFGVGVVATLVGLLVFFRDLRTVLQLLVVAALGTAAVGALVLVLAQTVPAIHDRIEYVITGRGEGSAAGRFEIWESGIRILTTDAPLLGVGPDAFRLITGKEMHNDLLSFAVERGPFGLLALLVFLAAALRGGLQTMRLWGERGTNRGLVFPVAMVAIVVVSLTHEIFHQRPLWLFLALQEGMRWRALGTAQTEPAPTPAPVPAPG